MKSYCENALNFLAHQKDNPFLVHQGEDEEDEVEEDTEEDDQEEEEDEDTEEEDDSEGEEEDGEYEDLTCLLCERSEKEDGEEAPGHRQTPLFEQVDSY